MPVTTRRQHRNNLILEEVESKHKQEMVELFYKYCKSVGNVGELGMCAQPEYFPCYAYHDLANDLNLQSDLYGKVFRYNFSDWPKSCWLEPHYSCSGFQELFHHLKMKQLFPYAYRIGNPNKKVDVKIDVTLNNYSDADGYFYWDSVLECNAVPLGTDVMRC